jgi:hypothetical protein
VKLQPGVALGGFITFIVTALLFAATIGTWLTMLGLGVLHSRIPEIPALGFFDSFFVAIGLALIGVSSRGGGVSRSS